MVTTRRPYLTLIVFVLTSIGAFGCAIHRPCTEAGDLAGLPLIKGDKRCNQKELPDGTIVNHGQFTQKHPNGKLAIEGQFELGRKSGIWVYYDETGKPTTERYYNDNGVEIVGARPKSAEQAEAELESSATYRYFRRQEAEKAAKR